MNSAAIERHRSNRVGDILCCNFESKQVYVSQSLFKRFLGGEQCARGTRAGAHSRQVLERDDRTPPLALCVSRQIPADEAAHCASALAQHWHRPLTLAQHCGANKRTTLLGASALSTILLARSAPNARMFQSSVLKESRLVPSQRPGAPRVSCASRSWRARPAAVVVRDVLTHREHDARGVHNAQTDLDARERPQRLDVRRLLLSSLVEEHARVLDLAVALLKGTPYLQELASVVHVLQRVPQRPRYAYAGEARPRQP